MTKMACATMSAMTSTRRFSDFTGYSTTRTGNECRRHAITAGNTVAVTCTRQKRVSPTFGLRKSSGDKGRAVTAAARHATQKQQPPVYEKKTVTATKSKSTRANAKQTQHVRGGVAKQQAPAGGTIGDKATVGDVVPPALPPPTTTTTTMTSSSADFCSRQSWNEDVEDTSRNCSTDFVATPSTGCDVASSNTSAGRLRRLSYVTNRLRFPPISSGLRNPLGRSTSDDANNKIKNVNDEDRSVCDCDYCVYLQNCVPRRSVDAVTQLQAVIQSTASSFSSGSDEVSDSKPPGRCDTCAALLPQRAAAQVGQRSTGAATRAARWKRSTAAVACCSQLGRKNGDGAVVLRKWNSQPALELPRLPPGGRGGLKSDTIAAASSGACAAIAEVTWPSDSRCDTPTTRMVISWLADVDRCGLLERPPSPVIVEDEPTQTDTAIHIVYDGD
jgi:hypothetical protein